MGKTHKGTLHTFENIYQKLCNKFLIKQGVTKKLNSEVDEEDLMVDDLIERAWFWSSDDAEQFIMDQQEEDANLNRSTFVGIILEVLIEHLKSNFSCLHWSLNMPVHYKKEMDHSAGPNRQAMYVLLSFNCISVYTQRIRLFTPFGIVIWRKLSTHQ